MKVAIYSPYLDTFGGGERYIATIAEVLLGIAKVDILLDEHLFSFGGQFLKKSLEDRFGLNLSNADFIKAPIGKGSNFLQRPIFLKQYDLLVYLTDGSIFIPSARRNILHIQTPLVGQPSKSVWGKIKLKLWDLIIYNSNFTKKWSEKNWPLKSEVIYPPVDTDKIKPLKKKKYILSVGRFFRFLKDKKHEFLIKVFKDLNQDKRAKDWSLHLVGSAAEGDKPYIDQLKNLAKGLPINFYPNMRYDDLIELYGHASVYWHASGFGEQDPKKMEHFGISTVEAMAGGCVPVVISKGGQVETVEDGKSGLLWNSLDELKKYTLKLIENTDILEKLSREAQERAKSFSKAGFAKQILSLV